MQFWATYGLFLAKTVTLVFAILILLAGILTITRKGKSGSKNKLTIKKINEKFADLAETLQAEILDKKAYKAHCKQKKAAEKNNKKQNENKKRVFVLQFHGDMRASAVASLREEITAILQVATAEDEVVIRLESAGGLVSAYGLAASQLERLRNKKIPLTITIDKIAASGGYMMACVANRILAAPFAIIGSIGVVAQVPNFHRLLKKNDIDFEQLTAGEYKRTLTMFGENTEKARMKFQEELEEVHQLFKNFIQQNRPLVNIQQIATGEHWLASKALELKLIDELITSDNYLLNASQQADIYEVSYTTKKSLSEKIGIAAQVVFNSLSGRTL
jgi:serine protease SohB